MKVILPTDENMGYLSTRGAHFGKAKYYTVILLEEGKIADVKSVPNPGHNSGACGNAVANIMALEPDAMVVSGIGASPAKGFANAGLELYFDQASPTVLKSVQLLVEGKLEKSSGNGTCAAH